MKISPVSSGGIPGQSIGAISTERTSPDRLASAKAVAMGESPMRLQPSETPTDPQVARMHMRSLKMKTNHSPDRELVQALEQAQTATPSATAIDNEGGSEATKPLSPQFAALAKQRRALQQERQLFEQEKAHLKTTSTDGSNDLAARLKEQTLEVLKENGALTPEFYNSMTEYLMNPELAALKAEIKALKEGVDKNFVDRDTQAEQQVLSEMRKEAELLAREGDTFELVREMRAVPKVTDLIYRTYKQTGEVLDVQEAMNLVENQLFEDNSRIANFKKIQAKFQPPQQEPQLQQQQPRQLRTLTNRDTAQPPMDRRSRAMMAALGQLKR